MDRNGIFRKRFSIPLFRREVRIDEGTADEPVTVTAAQGLHLITDGWQAHPVSKLRGWLQ